MTEDKIWNNIYMDVIYLEDIFQHLTNAQSLWYLDVVTQIFCCHVNETLNTNQSKSIVQLFESK